MKPITLGMGSRVSIADKIQRARAILSKMGGNPSFANPDPALATVADATTALENAYDASLDGSRSAKIRLHQCESELIDYMKLLAAYVFIASKGEEHIVAGSGFELRRDKTPVGSGNPSNVRGKATHREGEVTLVWNKAMGARIYTVQISLDGSVWSDCGLTTKNRMVVSGLVGGTKPLFRVAAVGTRGQSGWSDPSGVYVH